MAGPDLIMLKLDGRQ